MRVGLIAIAALAALGPLGARAGQLEIQPVLVTLSPGERSALVTVRNGGSEPVRYEVSAMTWTQDARGESRYEPSDALTVYPPLFRLAPGERRRVRVGAAALPADREASYRLFVQELPPERKVAGRPRVSVLTRFALPVFVAPPARAPRLELAALQVARGRAAFDLLAPGNVHVRPSALRLLLEAEGGAAVHERAIDTWYVLAGGRRAHDLALPREACARAARIRVEVTTPAGPVSAAAAVPPGACDP
jgi:fimbrial chaperone protein